MTTSIPAYVGWRERWRMPRVRERPGRGQLRVDHATMGRIEVDGAVCTGCQLCVRICPAQALVMAGPHDVAMTGELAACIACGDCVAICPPDAVKLVRPMHYEGYYKTLGRGALTPPRLF